MKNKRAAEGKGTPSKGGNSTCRRQGNGTSGRVIPRLHERGKAWWTLNRRASPDTKLKSKRGENKEAAPERKKWDERKRIASRRGRYLFGFPVSFQLLDCLTLFFDCLCCD